MNILLETGVCEGRNEHGTRFVVKPVRLMGEGRRLCPFSEIYAYEVSKAMDLGVVPKTIRVLIDKGPASAQEYLPGKVRNLRELTEDDHVDRCGAGSILVLDCILGNTDRTFNNVLVDEQGNLWAIDNGFGSGFQFEAERVKRRNRRDLAVFEVNLLDRYGYLNTGLDLLKWVDWDYAFELAENLQETYENKWPEDKIIVEPWVEESRMANRLIAQRINMLPDLLGYQYIWYKARAKQGGVVAVDIDGVIAHKLPNGNYPEDYKIKKPIEGFKEGLIYLQRNRGNFLVLFTSRMEIDRPWTEEWLRKYEVPYDLLVMGKVPAVNYIDDRAIEFYNWGDVITHMEALKTK